MERPGLAVHRSIVVVDIEGFGDRCRTNTHRVAVRAGLYQVLRQAFDEAGVSWTDCGHEDRGDGVFILAPAEMPKARFVNALPGALVKALREHNATHSHEVRIRLRMALHAGEVTYDQHGVTAAAVNLAFRLLDAAPLKTALAESPGVLAVITSGWFFDEVVRHTPACAATTYRPIQVSVKETFTMAWISLPDHPFPPVPAYVTDPPAERLADVSRSLPRPRVGATFNELPVPRQLPLAVRDFTGRAEHLAALDALLPNDHACPGDPTGADPAGAVVITAIDGTAGVGKTALALYWAHRVRHRFPDGTLYVNLRGSGPGQPATPAEVLDSFLRALGCPPRQIPITLEAQSALYRSLLTDRRVLIVLDNANAAQQVRPLLPGSPGCLVLITSRASLTGLIVNEAATRLTLDLLTSSEALDLVRGSLGADRVAAEPEAVATLIQLCARLPLALRIATARAASRPRLAVADVVAEMEVDRARLDTLSPLGDDPTSVRAVFDWSYHQLDTGQARLFRRLGLHPGPEISLHAAATTADLDLPNTRRLLDTLTDAHLVEAVARDRYRMHDLLYTYAADRAEHADSSEDRDQARRTLLEWYAHHSLAAHRILFPALTNWHPLSTLDTHAQPIIAFAGTTDAWTWLDTEQANLIAAAHHATDHNLPKLAILISHTGSAALFRRGAWNALLDLAELGLVVARRSGDRQCECNALSTLAGVHQRVGKWAESFAGRQEALVLAKALGEPSLEAVALNDLGSGCLGQERYTEAIGYLQPALPLSRGAQHGRLEGVIETTLSAGHLGLGQYDQALSHAEHGRTLRRHAGDREGEAHALWLMARARQGMGAHAEAIILCEQAVKIGRDHVYPPCIADVLRTLGTSLRDTGDVQRAATCWREALEIFDRFADPRGDELRICFRALEKANSISVKNGDRHPTI
jgi:tetratricopeptide (TPR) repeat protein